MSIVLFPLFLKCILNILILLTITNTLALLEDYIHTYIIGRWNPLVRITTQLLTLFMLCVLFLHVSGGAYSLKSIPNYRFLRNFSMAISFTLTVFARNFLSGSCRRNIFHIGVCIESTNTLPTRQRCLQMKTFYNQLIWFMHHTFWNRINFFSSK